MEEKVKKEEKPKFVDLLTNAGFKAVFGDEANQDVVMTIINEFLPEHRQDTAIRYLPTEHQSYVEEGWFQRCACYASRAYDRQSRKGKGYDIAPVYLIGLMGVPVMHPDPELWKDRYISEYTFREKSTGDLLAETIIIIFVELASFDKTLEECETHRDRMMYILKNIGRLMERSQWLQNQVYERLFRACEIAAFSEEKRIEYEKDMNDEKRLYGMLAAQHKEGRAEGLKEGREEGIRATAIKMLELSMPVDVIASVTGLTEDQINALRTE